MNRYSKYLFLLAVGPLLLYNNCSQLVPPQNFGSAGNLSLSACDEQLKVEFAKTYYPFLQTCNGCHTYGGAGNGAFADSNLSYAFTEFQVRGSDLINQRALDSNHNAPYTGPTNQTALDSIEPSWKAAVAQNVLCKSSAGGDPGDGGPIDEIPPPINEASYYTNAKVMAGTQSVQTLTWDLGSEIVAPSGQSFPGLSLSISVEPFISPTGDTAYIFSEPILITASEDTRLAYIEIAINGVLIDSATTYKGIDTVIPASSDLNSGLLSRTFMVVPSTLVNSDALSLGIGVIGDGVLPGGGGPPPPPPPPPASVTHSSLIATGGILQRNCFGCHGQSPAFPAGNPMDLTDYDALVARGVIVPGNANASLIHQRLNDPINPMPRGGPLLPQVERDAIRDWINAGAPR